MNYPKTVQDSRDMAADFRATPAYRAPMLFSIGRRLQTQNGTIASVRYPVVNGPSQNLDAAAFLIKALQVDITGVQNISLSREMIDEVLQYFTCYEGDGKRHMNIEALKEAREVASNARTDSLVASFIFDDSAPQGVEDATLKLYGLSNRHFKPGQLNFAEVFKKLPNVAWMGDEPMDSDEIDEALMASAFGNGWYCPHMVDKFPLYIHRINAVKMGVRITDQNKVRLGAYLGEGTTLMPGASYINFNAGTEGPAMVEGRVSSGAFIGKGTDIGGGASLLGILSGGNNVPISTGHNCLLEVNCVLGIPVGDAVIIAAETAVLASSQVRVLVEGHALYGETVKGSHLVGINAVTFRRNDKDGVLEVVRTPRNVIAAEKLENGQSILSADLHKNN